MSVLSRPQLGVHGQGATPSVSVWSAHATSMELRVFSASDPDWVSDRIPMQATGDGVFTASTPLLVPGALYAIGADGPEGPAHRFDSERHLLDPYSRGVVRAPSGGWRSTVIDESFDWGGVTKPRTPRDRTIIYEAHVKGFTKLNPALPDELRGTYAGLAHPSAIEYLHDLGITAVELLPVHQSVSEQRLVTQGRTNYWGYNPLHWFAPHDRYATRRAQHEGPSGIVREFKSMVRALHDAGIQVFLDVVYNHTAEEGASGPTHSLRGIDNASYYRHRGDGSYIDVTGCGNSVDFSTTAAVDLTLDSLRYWANECQVDGFRFDLAVTLGRGEHGGFDPHHPLIRGIVEDPALADTVMIAEPWDLGHDGWQTGRFGSGWSEWNDGFRDQSRTFWLSDYRAARQDGSAHHGVGGLAHAIAGSAGTFTADRGPTASVNYVTAHDGFTMTDLVRYDRKHNEGNGEQGRDGTDNNRSYNHGIEGWTDDWPIRLDRRKSMRNLMGTLLLSAGVPMITMGDEYGRTARGNNNAYCHDSALNWIVWDRKEWHQEILDSTRLLTALRHRFPALRPKQYGVDGESLAAANEFHWFNAAGDEMTVAQWDNTEERTLQALITARPDDEPASRVLIVVHGSPRTAIATLPDGWGITGFELLWDSALEHLDPLAMQSAGPGEIVAIPGMSMRLWQVTGEIPGV